MSGDNEPTEAELESALGRVKVCIDDVLARLQREALEVHPASVLTALEVVVAVTLAAGRTPAEVFFEGVTRAGHHIVGRLPPPQTAACIHCKQEVAPVTDVEAIRTIAITARAMMNDEATIEDLREMSDTIGNATAAARLEYLPPKFRGGSSAG